MDVRKYVATSTRAHLNSVIADSEQDTQNLSRHYKVLKELGEVLENKGLSPGRNNKVL